MPNKAVFVIGPESSGTRLITRLFVEIGFYGDTGHDQELDKLIKRTNGFFWPNKDIVFRRSVPHAQKWPDIPSIYTKLYDLGYDTKLVITIREHYPICASKYKNNHSKKQNAESDLCKQIYYIFSSLIFVENFYVVSTSHLFHHPAQSIKDLFIWTGVNVSDDKVKQIAKTVYDADDKHYR